MERRRDARGSKPKRTGFAWLAGGLVAVLIAGGLIVWRTLGPLPASGETSGSQPGACESKDQISVAVDEATAPAVQEVAAAYHEKYPCRTATVLTWSDDLTLQSLSTDTSPDIWVAGGSSWVEAAKASGMLVSSSVAVATSPIVLAMPTAAADALGWSGSISHEQLDPVLDVNWNWGAAQHPEWGDLAIRSMIAGVGQAGVEPVAALLENMLTDASAGLSERAEDQWRLISMRRAFSSQPTISDTLPWQKSPSIDDAMRAANAVITSENVVAAYAAKNPSIPVTALYLSDPARSIEVSAVTLPDGLFKGAIASDFVAELQAAGDEVWTGSNLRALGSTEAPAFTGTTAGLSATQPTSPVAPSGAVRAQTERTWRWIHQTTATVSMIDFSGSMSLKFPGTEASRKDVLLDSLTASMPYARTDDQAGMMIFHTADGVNAIEEVAPLAPNGNFRDPNSNLALTMDGLRQTPVSGDTPLYQAIINAFNLAKAKYQEGAYNQVIVLTDGKEESDGSTTRADVIQTLQSFENDGRKVSLVLIGMGADADMEDLYEIAAQTRATVLQLTDPADAAKVVAQSFYAMR